MTRRKTTYPGAVLYVRHFLANVPGPTVCATGGKSFVQVATPYMRYAFYSSPEATVCKAWNVGYLRKSRKTYRLDGINYALRHLS